MEDKLTQDIKKVLDIYNIELREVDDCFVGCRTDVYIDWEYKCISIEEIISNIVDLQKEI